MLNLNDFVLNQRPSRNIIEEYEDKIPSQVIDIWKQYGFGSIKKGYLKVINPNDYITLLQLYILDMKQPFHYS